MKVSKAASAETRSRILEVASRLLRARGLEGVGIAEIMKAAGQTHGGFYGRFASRAALADAACDAGFAEVRPLWEASAATGGAAGLALWAEHYLSAAHRDTPDRGCLLAALGPDAARAEAPIRARFTAEIRRYRDLLAGLWPGSAAARRRRATAALATAVGALVLARAVDDAALTDELLSAARDSILHDY